MPESTSPADAGSRRDGLPHMVQLDGLRTVAVFAVFLQHFRPFSLPFFAGLPLGELGVQLFFVLSGFLITSILLRCRDLVDSGGQSRGFTLRQFYARRFLRIFPLYYVALATAALLNLEGVRKSIAYSVLYLSNVYSIVTHGQDGRVGHFWSLAVEEQFYLVWPLVILLTPGRRLLLVVCGAVLLGPLFRIVATILGLEWHARMYLPFGCMDTLGMGAMLALCDHDAVRLGGLRRWILRVGALLAGPLLVLCCVAIGLGKAPRGLDTIALRSISAFFFAWLIAGAGRGFGGPAGRLLSSRPMTYLGKISYGLYVIHNFVPELVDRFIGPSSGGPLATAPARSAVYALVTVGIASVSWVVLERTLNELKRYFPYDRAARPSRGAPTT